MHEQGTFLIIKYIFIEGTRILDFKSWMMVIGILVIGIILGINLRDKIYTKYETIKKNCNSNKEKVITFAFAVIVGLIIGILIMLILKSNIIDSLSGWVSGLGTWAAVMLSLWLASGRKSRLKVAHGRNYEKQNKQDKKEINFVVYNLSDTAMSLKFYGIKKPDDDDFQVDDVKNYKYKSVKAGDFQENILNVDFIEDALKIDNNYEGKIISCFGEPDGNLHCEVIDWKEEMSKFEKLNKKIKYIQ